MDRRRIYLLDRGLPTLNHPSGLVEKRTEKSIHYEARNILPADDDLLLESLRQSDGQLESIRACSLSLGHLDERHENRRVEKVDTDEAFGPATGRSELRDRYRACVRGENCALGQLIDFDK